MIKPKNKINGIHIEHVKFPINFCFFRLRAEIEHLQNEIETNKPLLEHYKKQIDILEKRTPSGHSGKSN